MLACGELSTRSDSGGCSVDDRAGDSCWSFPGDQAIIAEPCEIHHNVLHMWELQGPSSAICRLQFQVPDG
jgi:hypothetical protein